MKTHNTLWPLALACGLLAPPTPAQTAPPTPAQTAPPTPAQTAPPAQAAAPTDISGLWAGALDTGAIKLRLLFRITGPPGAMTGTLDSLDQNVNGMPLSAVTLSGDALHLEVPSVHGAFDGKRSADGAQFVGTWTQGAASLPLSIGKTDQPPAPPRRPQEPQPPYPYAVQDVSFASVKGVTLAGTLTLPHGRGPFPAVALVAGSGPNTRDEVIFGHHLFLVLADDLTRHGVAVLRYDKRGIGQSTGDYAQATSADFTDDALAAVHYLKTRTPINPRRIGLIGHSEGGLIAPLAATRSRDIAFVVLMAGPGLPGDQILLRQSALIAAGMGAPAQAVAQEGAMQRQVFAVVKAEPDPDAARQKILALTEKSTATQTPEVRAAALRQTQTQMNTILSPWFRFFLSYDPAPTLKRVRCPVLALNGSRDLQVPPREDLAAIAAALKAGGNADYATEELPGLNHLFQTCQTGLPSEYGAIEETISPHALQVIRQWIGKHTLSGSADTVKRRP